jgi:hypothetical protein
MDPPTLKKNSMKSDAIALKVPAMLTVLLFGSL